MRARWTAIALLLAAVLQGRAQPVPTPTPTAGTPPDAREAAALLEQGRSNLQEAPLERALLYYSSRPGDPDAVRACARIDYYRALGEDSRKQRDRAKKILDEGIGWAQQAVRSDPGSGPAHALLADLYGEKIALGDVFTAMDIGPKDAQENEKALSLAPLDAGVLAAQGRRYLMAPDFAGGDPRKALVFFRRSLEADPDSDETWLWLARACRRLKDPAGFQQALDKARSLDPQNVQVEWEAEKKP
ncbi:MAG TPA: tetratricopeptide repeat protein [bacterium]|nr:tetratricopeptide repeat protein [bacterium]